MKVATHIVEWTPGAKEPASMEGMVAVKERPRIETDSAVVRFAGDSGDGMQLTGGQFTLSTALFGHDLATFPDYPAEIRAPAGTTFGVSAFQINFGGREIMTSGDAPDVLVAMNPAALKVHIDDVKPNGLVIVDTGSFNERNLRKAGYETNPLEDGSLKGYRVLALDISKLTLAAVEPAGLSQRDALRCKNMWTLGLVLWMFGRDRQPIIDGINRKFRQRNPQLADANILALNAGHICGEAGELPPNVTIFRIPKAKVEPGLYRAVTGAEALAWGLVVGAHKAGLKLFLGSYPITPASTLLHTLSSLRQYNVVTFQAEDEIAAICSAIGASYAGAIGVTSSSGPGIALKTEALGLAIATELPLIVVNSQRAGPSTGMPTKTEQSDLFQAVWGRNGDAPLVVLASRSPADCFDVAIEAIRLATKFMTPVMLLTDGYLANASEPWLIPDIDKIAPFPAKHRTDPEGFYPFQRDEKTLARTWAIPGTPGLEHRIGGLERNYKTGHISYDPANHQKMTEIRKAKIDGVANDIPEQDVALGPGKGKIAIVGWGSTYGPIHRAVINLNEEGIGAAHIHLRYLWPLPRNLGDLLRRYERVIVPEMNTGQLVKLLRAEYLIPAEGVNKISGQPFKVTEIEAAVHRHLETVR
jgi:2-oxoglutarate ferredoxin oxidoreductase subunit alpha